MADDPIFTPFEPIATPVPTTDPPKRNRRQRAANGASKKKRAAALSRPQTASPAPAAEPKKRRGRKASSVAGGFKLDLQTAITVTAGLKPEDAHLLTQMVGALQKTSKKSRGRIIAALGKLVP